MLLLEKYEGLGTYWWIKVYENLDRKTSVLLQHSVTKILHQFENDYSRFKAQSYVSRLNRNRRLLFAPSDMKEMVRLGLRLNQGTGGMFSLGVGGMLEERGYDSRYTFSSTPNPRFSRPVEVVLEKDGLFLRGDGNLDLGGIGKGYLIDKLADLLLQRGIKYFMINGGGDIYASSDNGRPVKVYLQHPFDAKIVFADVDLKDAAVCVSSPAKRRWHDRGRDFTHIINPLRPEMAESEVGGSVVIGSRCAIVDALATVFCIMDEKSCLEAAALFNVRYRKVNR